MSCDKLIGVDDIAIKVIDTTFNSMAETHLHNLPLRNS